MTRITGRDSNLRAVDADREHIADRLRTCHAEGRLDLTEFQERLERCYDAKTFGELGEIVKDLPRTFDTSITGPQRFPRQRQLAADAQATRVSV